jgi:hypothetical protein
MAHIASQRLAGQGFYAPKLRSPEAVVAWLGAIQAQDYAGVKWSIGLRLPGCNDDDVEQAIASQAVVRTWVMRGTLHFVAAEDARWLLTLLGPRVIAKNERRYRQLELDEATLARSNEILVRALQNFRQLDRAALRDILEEEGISTAGQRLFYMLQRAALDRLICQGTAPKNNPLFTLLPQPEVPGQPLHREVALAELAARYFSSRGPATLDDFVWWSGMLVADAKAGVEAAKHNLVQDRIGDKVYWLAETGPPASGFLPQILLLPGFDEYLVSYRDRSASVPEAYVEAWSKSKAMFSPSILLRGQVAGLWKRTIKKNSVLITADRFRELTAGEERSLQEAANEYGRFLNKPAILQPG